MSTVRCRVAGLAIVAAVDVAWLLVEPRVVGWWRWVPMLIAVVTHFAFVSIERRSPTLSWQAVLAASIPVIVVAVAVTPRWSGDLYIYGVYGRMVTVYHSNPYFQVPGAFPNDNLLRATPRAWLTTRTVYGPFFTAVSAAGSYLFGSSIVLTRLFFQSLAGLSLVAALVALARARVPSYALVAVGLAPALLAVVNGGNCDLLAGAGLLGGILLLRQRRSAVSGLAIGLAALVKLLALPAAAGVLVAMALRREKQAFSFGAVFAATVGVGYALVGGVRALDPLRSDSTHVSRVSLWHGVPLVIAWLMREFDHPLAHLPPAAELAHVAILVIAALIAAFVYRRRRTPDPAVFAIGATLLFLLGSGYVLPWYSAVAVPLAMVAAPSRLASLVQLQAALLLVAYVSPAGTPPAAVPLAAGAGVVISLVLVAILLVALWSRDAGGLVTRP